MHANCTRGQLQGQVTSNQTAESENMTSLVSLPKLILGTKAPAHLGAYPCFSFLTYFSSIHSTCYGTKADSHWSMQSGKTGELAAFNESDHKSLVSEKVTDYCSTSLHWRHGGSRSNAQSRCQPGNLSVVTLTLQLTK